MALTALSYVTFAWFQFNRRAEIGGTQIDVNGNFDVTYSLYQDDVYQADGNLIFSNYYPGQVHRRKMTIVANNFDSDVLMTWFFKAPSELEEIPYIDTLGDYGTAGDYYYLGSQIVIDEVFVKVNNVVTTTNNAEGTYLVTTNSVGLSKGQVNSVSSAVTFQNINIVESTLLPFGQSAVIDVYFTFVDNGTNQNVYKNVWATTELQAGFCHFT